MFGRKYHTRVSELISGNTIVMATAAKKIAKATVATVAKDDMIVMGNDVNSMEYCYEPTAAEEMFVVCVDHACLPFVRSAQRKRHTHK